MSGPTLVIITFVISDKNLRYDSYNSYSSMDHVFICEDCGMVFVTSDPNFTLDD